MNIKSLLFTSFAALAMTVSAEKTVVFDFTKPSNLDKMTFVPLTLSDLKTGKYSNESTDPAKDKDRFYVSGKNVVLVVSGSSFTYDGVTIEMSNPDKYKDYPRFFIGNTASAAPSAPGDYNDDNFIADMRWYQTEEIKFTAPSGMSIKKIVMNAEVDGTPVRCVLNNTIVETEGGTQTFGGTNNEKLNTWTANPGTEATTVVYKAEKGCATQAAYIVEVTLAELGSGVAEIAEDLNVPAVYYNLQGIQVSNPENGIFIRRQGNKVEKVYVK